MILSLLFWDWCNNVKIISKKHDFDTNGVINKQYYLMLSRVTWVM